MLKNTCAFMLLGLMGMNSFAAHIDDVATERSPWLLRARAIVVAPCASSSTISLIDGNASVDTDIVIPEIDISYFFTDHIAAELILGVSRHDVKAKNTIVGTVNLGEVSVLPPTLTAQYHFLPDKIFDPYIGAGINYSHFFRENPGALATKTSFSNSVGAALQVGLDINLTENWQINLDAKKIYMRTKVKAVVPNVGTASTHVDIDPMIYGLGIGYFLS